MYFYVAVVSYCWFLTFYTYHSNTSTHAAWAMRVVSFQSLVCNHFHFQGGLFKDTTICFLSDVDECSKNGSPCGENAECFNNDGSYTCICKDGFTGDGRDCLGKLHCGNKCLIVKQFTYLLIFYFVFNVFVVAAVVGDVSCCRSFWCAKVEE